MRTWYNYTFKNNNTYIPITDILLRRELLGEAIVIQITEPLSSIYKGKLVRITTLICKYNKNTYKIYMKNECTIVLFTATAKNIFCEFCHTICHQNIRFWVVTGFIKVSSESFMNKNKIKCVSRKSIRLT